MQNTNIYTLMKKYNCISKKHTIVAALLCCFIACKKDDNLPGFGNSQPAYINFNNISEVINQASDHYIDLATQNMVYLNDSTNNTAFSRYPEFGSSVRSSAFGRSFPFNSQATGIFLGSDVISVPSDANYDLIYWMPILPGQYKFIFTSLNKTYLKDTTLSLNPKTYALQYLVESPERNDAYRIATVPTSLETEQSKTTIQTVNLSPDLGNIDLWRSDKNGNKINTSLPTGLGFGRYHATLLDTTGTSTTNGRIYINVSLTGTNKKLLTVAVPALSGSSFVLLIQGFNQQTARRIKSSNSAYTSMIVNPNLRFRLSRLF